MQACQSPSFLLVPHNNVQYYYSEQDQKFAAVPDIQTVFQAQLLHSLQEKAAFNTGSSSDAYSLASTLTQASVVQKRDIMHLSQLSAAFTCTNRRHTDMHYLAHLPVTDLETCTNYLHQHA